MLLRTYTLCKRTFRSVNLVSTRVSSAHAPMESGPKFSYRGTRVLPYSDVAKSTTCHSGERVRNRSGDGNQRDKKVAGNHRAVSNECGATYPACWQTKFQQCRVHSSLQPPQKRKDLEGRCRHFVFVCLSPPMFARGSGSQTSEVHETQRGGDPGTAPVNQLFVGHCRKSGAGFCNVQVQCRPR